ncbi:MAG: FkbM family methyltransferase [Magnetovibrio sp.]|nr:FkbM family methyltransferase [Magnetovibrio sp.]
MSASENPRGLKRLGQRLRKKARKIVHGGPDDFLKSCRGVIHVGANTGQERDLYAAHDLDVVWIEPIPDVFATLAANTDAYPRQAALRALITERAGDTHTLHVANNEGASSSILELDQHRDIWPEVDYVADIELVSESLPSALAAAGIDTGRHDALIIDTQGTELMVLEGAAPMLAQFTHVRTEAADFPAYKGAPRRPASRPTWPATGSASPARTSSRGATPAAPISTCCSRARPDPGRV